MESHDFYMRPCPFCGSGRVTGVEIDRQGRTICFAWCQDCYAQGPRAEDKIQAAALWNRQHAPAEQPERTERSYHAPPPGDLDRHEKAIGEILDRFMEGK